MLLDTNLYRALSPGSVQELRLAEQRAGFMAAGSFHTILELGAHLADPADPDHRHCRAALAKLYAHTRRTDETGDHVPITGDREAILALTLFGVRLEAPHRAAERYGAFLRTIARQQGPILPTLQPTLTALRDRAERVKSEFVAQAVQWTEAMSGGTQSWNSLEGLPDRRREFLRALDQGTGVRFEGIEQLISPDMSRSARLTSFGLLECCLIISQRESNRLPGVSHFRDSCFTDGYGRRVARMQRFRSSAA